MLAQGVLADKVRSVTPPRQTLGTPGRSQGDSREIAGGFLGDPGVIPGRSQGDSGSAGNHPPLDGTFLASGVPLLLFLLSTVLYQLIVDGGMYSTGYKPLFIQGSGVP